MWFMDQEAAFEVETEPYIINVQESAYYRTNYNKKNWQDLANILNDPKNFMKIHELNRAQLIDDSMNLARAGILDYETTLDLVSYLRHETEYIPWVPGFQAFSYVFSLINRDGLESEEARLMKTFLLDLFDAKFTELGFSPKPDDSHLDILTRSAVDKWMCLLGNKDCSEAAIKYFQDWMNDESKPVPRNIEDVIYQTAIKEGGFEEWNFIFEKFKSVEVDSERKSYIYAMGASEDEAILTEYLKKTISRDESQIKVQDCLYIFRAIGTNRVGRNVALKWLEEDYDKIKESFGGSFASSPVANIMRGYASTASTDAEIQRLAEFFNAHSADLQAIKKTFSDSIESAKINQAWMEHSQDSILEWLKQWEAGGQH